MNRLASLVVLGLVLAGPAAAQKVYGPGGTTIYPIDGAVFEVVGPPSDKTMWCGAAKYARSVAKVGWKTPIVVVRGPEPSAFEDGRRQGTRFTVDPASAITLGVDVNGDNVGTPGDLSLTLRRTTLGAVGSMGAPGFLQV